jgi:two-component system, OmpR family, phosphate regulon sensor histidine kinase PhoR
MKNANLKQIALIASSLITLSFTLLLGINQLVVGNFHWLSIPVLALCSFASSYVIIHYFVDSFVYRRIKVLYKNIHDLKVNKNAKLNLNSDDPISEVEQQVHEFSTKKSSEIEEFRKMEQYRREFMGDVSHELKTPIFNTQGYIETLLNGALDNPKVNASYLKKASKNLDRLSDIVDKLLSISENESGNLNLDIKKFDLVKLVNEVFETHEMAAEMKEITLALKKENSSSKMVIADRNQIEIVLNNLVINAIKYGNDDGHVLVGIYLVDKKVLIEVADDGPGIAKEHLPRLFDRFYRIDKHRSRFEGGNGLGLSICKHIIEAHEQTIHVRSTLGAGSTFGFTLNKA